jgi:hypothetical protein
MLLARKASLIQSLMPPRRPYSIPIARRGMPRTHEPQILKWLKPMLGKSPIEPFFSEKSRPYRHVAGICALIASLVGAYRYLTKKNLEGAAFVRQSMINLRLNETVLYLYFLLYFS